MVQYFLRTLRPAFYAWLTRMLYSGSKVHIGKHFKCDSIPRILIDKGASLHIGDHVELRRNVELRVHQKAQVNIGSKVRIDRGVRILAANEAQIDIADKVRIGLYAVFNGGDNISVGKGCLISGFVYLQTSMHGFKSKNLGIQQQGYAHAPVQLEEDCWLGTHVVILPDVHLEKGVVVGSNAVVNNSATAYQVLGGVPARELKQRT